MKPLAVSFSILTMFLLSCGKSLVVDDPIIIHDTIVVHDTIIVHEDGLFTYNLPCKIEYINQELPGKSILVFFLHGGVHDRPLHDLLTTKNHIDQNNRVGYNGTRDYLLNSKTKAIYIAPICHKAVNSNCVRWKDCENDIKRIIDDYASKGIIDENRVYVLGSSDGGVGTWDLIERHPDWFAAAMPMSCKTARYTPVPVYYHSTKSEGDVSGLVNAFNAKGCNIQYQYHATVKHGGDEVSCNEENLKKLFSHVRE